MIKISDNSWEIIYNSKCQSFIIYDLLPIFNHNFRSGQRTRIFIDGYCLWGYV